MLLTLKHLILGPSLAHTVGMRSLASLVALLALPLQASPAQHAPVPAGAIVASVEVSGFDIHRLSPGLQQAILGLAGTAVDQNRLDELASRIEAEHPDHVAAGRAVMDPDGRVRVVFVVGRPRARDPDQEQEENVNTRYVVEHAELRGVRESEVTGEVRDALQALVDKRLDSAEAAEIERRLRRALSRYDLTRRMVRGSQPGRIRVIYEARLSDRPRWLRFEPLRSNVTFHSEQGWGSYLDLAIGGRNFRFTPIVAIDNGDDLIEEYSGFGLRFESRRLGTRRLGASLEWSRFDQTWRDATLDALAANPEIARAYEDRTTIAPLVSFAFTPDITVSTGLSISELDARAPATGSEMANAAVASVAFAGRYSDAGGAAHDVYASFGVRAGLPALESDLDYRRYLGQGWYRYQWGRHAVVVKGMAGAITGEAPLFERFALGDSRTLRGWDKYDIAPAGGDRMVHASLQYAYRGIGVFLDAGSVWDEGRDPSVRVSTGLEFQAGPAFLTIGFPLNTDDVRAIVSLGIRIGGIRLER